MLSLYMIMFENIHPYTQGRSDSEDDYEDYEENDEKEQTQITSKDAFGKNEFIGTDMTEKKRRKLKRVNCLKFFFLNLIY